MSRRLYYLPIAVFALVQSLQPLLHAHVGDSPSGPGSVHFHAATGAGRTNWTQLASVPDVASRDSPSIGAVDEHRRHERLLAHNPPPAMAHDGMPVASQAHAPASSSPPAALRMEAPRGLLPPALAPPRLR